MMSDLKIVITGDAKSVQAAFAAITSGAEKMGATVEHAGQEAGQSLARFEQTATQTAAETEARFEGIGNAIGKIGLAFGAFDLLASKAAGDSEASAARLGNAFQNANLDIQEYQGQINQLNSTGLHLAFDDEDVQDALARFVGQTKDVAKSIKDVQLAEDIARGTGKSLADATSLVVQAEAGRFRGLAQLGIVLDSTATKQDYLAAAQQRYAGSAQAYATTGAANFDRWKNSAENALESVGGKLEGLQLPIIALSTAASTLGPVTSAIKEIASAEKLAELGTGALSLAMGPVGLVGAAGLAVGGVALLTKGFLDYRESADAAKDATLNLQNLLYSLAAGGSGKELTAPLKDVSDEWSKLAATSADAMTQYIDITNQLVDANQAVQGATASGDQAALDSALATVAALEQQRDAIDKMALSGDQIDKITEDIDELFKKPGLDAQAAGKDLEWYFSLFESGQITAEKLVQYFNIALATWTQYSNAVVAGTDAIAHDNQVTAIHQEMRRQGMADQAAENDLITYHGRILAADTEATIIHDNARRRGMADEAAQTKAIQLQTGVLENQASTVGQTTSAISAYNEAQKSSPAYASAVAAAQGQQSVALDLARDALQGNTAATYDTSKSAALFTEAMKRQADAIANAKAEITDYRARLGEVHMVVNDGANQFAKHATIAGNALDSGQRVAIGNTTAIAQQSQGVADWADKLIGVRGVYAEIDKLLAKGTISQEEYNRAQSAETSILHNNAAIQRDVLKIQTDQAPLIAELTKRERDYMDTLASKPAQEQLVALGYMDQAESAKALAAAQLAAAAASGELGAKGEETATKMITAAAEADPVTEALLEDMGLISVGADGTITVHYDSVSGGKDETQLLIDAIDNFADVIAEAFGIVVTMDDGGSLGSLQSIVGLLNGLDGQTATYYVNEVKTGVSIGSPSGVGITPEANGGIIPAANGGVIVGENGPELLYRTGGGALVLPTGATQSKLAMGGSGGPDVHLHIHGNVYGMDDLTEQVTRQLVPAIVAATKRHYSGHGVRG